MPENRIVLRNCDVIAPLDIAAYVERDGFKALEKARSMTPEEVIQEVKASGLRGRGGGGFSCGVKWDLARKANSREKYLICNADEGEVGTFKDRYIIQKDPFSIMEGMAIAAYAIGAITAHIYLRAEYRFLRDVLLGAMAQAKEKGYLGELSIELREGAGAYICGEESALMNSIEGRRGESRFRPPYPPTHGLWGQPTIINNVETLANVPPILFNGSSWYSNLGTEQSKGTKVFCVSGDVEKPGVYELMLGCSLREVIDLAGGVKDIKWVQVGGSTGRIVPGDHIDTALSYETVLGSGAVMVFGKSRDVLDFAYRTVEFLNEESCGKCAPCREGTEVMKEILERLVLGEGKAGDIEALEELSEAMMLTSRCGLGQTAPIPVLDTLKYFRQDYEDRIRQSVFIRGLKVISA